jgi:uncharacterized protein
VTKVVDFNVERGIIAFNKGDYSTALSCFEPLAKRGDAKAQLLMGCVHEFGVSKNQDQALYWYHLAALQDNAEAQFRYALCVICNQATENYLDAISCLEKAASQGHEKAAYNLVERQFKFVEKLPNDPESFRVLTRLAKHGNSSAQFMLGVTYDRGYFGVAQDLSIAIFWYRKAAEQGISAAQTNLGMMHARGIGVTQDDILACKWYREAAEQGGADAQNNLGFMYEHGRGVPKSDVLAAEWYLKSAERGFDLGQVNSGLMYKFGRGVTKDEVLAYQWFMKATEQENAEAQFQVGRCYECGTGVMQNYGEAVRWYRLAVKKNVPIACQNLGFLYENGYGVLADYQEAAALYRKGAELGLASSQCCLAFMYQQGIGVHKNLKEAVKWYNKAAEQNDQRAIDELEKLKTF